MTPARRHPGRQPRPLVLSLLAATALASCAREPATSGGPSRAEHVMIVTIDTLRADRVGAYGYAAARTPVLDGIAAAGVRFTRGYTTAPITLPAHASLLTGRYPPGHASRHNGVAIDAATPTLATVLQSSGFSTGAFVSAFPLDRRFGLHRGFDVYDDELPRGADGKPQNERAGSDTVSRAIAWLNAQGDRRTFLWVHLFEPHAPYGDAASSRPLSARYDEEIATADRSVGRLLEALGARAGSTLVVVASDHGEAFGEHDEFGHSVFVYDTTLHIPLLMRGPQIPEGATVEAPASLVDVAPTVLELAGVKPVDSDGISLVRLFGRGESSSRVLYAESFAPLLDFGWSPLRSVREGDWKLITAPRPELYDVAADPRESQNLYTSEPQRAGRLRARADAFGGSEASPTVADREAANRLRSLGYLGGGAQPRPASDRPDPKDRIEVASLLAQVTSGEVRGPQLIDTLEAVLKEDPGNPQAHLRLGYAQLERNRCDRAEPHFRAAIDARVPSADAGLGLAQCRGRASDLAGAAEALAAADALEPGSPVVQANLGVLALARGDAAEAATRLRAAVELDPSLLEARFNLARALARLGRREEAAREANALLARLPVDAPQRGEVQRLLDALK